MKKFIYLFLFTLILNTGLAQPAEVRKKHFNIRKDIALEGFDPVSYHAGKPVKGKTEIKHTINGVTYLFDNTTNEAKFKANPEKFEPAYGGWCAYAMGETGEKVKIDPETFKIIDGKLFLFYNFWGNNTLTDWNKNEKKLKPLADRNWNKILQ